MVRFLYRPWKIASYNWYRYILHFFWILGGILGCLSALMMPERTAELMFHSVTASVNLSGLIASVFLPVLLSGISVYLCRRWILIAAAFFKAISFTYISVGLASSFPVSGWLIQFFMLFSDWCMMPILLWFWTRAGSCNNATANKDLMYLIISGILVFVFDYCIVLPFFTEILFY